ncbi:MAG TPA: hypothetical protein VF666_06270 [Pyrinomonadaceae bacterium]
MRLQLNSADAFLSTDGTYTNPVSPSTSVDDGERGALTHAYFKQSQHCRTGQPRGEMPGIHRV